MDNFKWTKFSDRYPDDRRMIYVTNNESVWISWFIKEHKKQQSENYSWCYVYMPEVPKRKKIEPNKELKGLSNDYILALENRIELLEIGYRKRQIEESKAFS